MITVMRRPRELRLRLDDPALEPFLTFAEVAYPNQPLAAPARELLMVGAGGDAATAAIGAVRLAAYRRFSAIARQGLAAALRQLASDLELEELIAREGLARDG
jgi:hypothetical protein